ncbi:5-formyltetrahydrofolate cyclo-ligase [Saccharomonospora saliphila]|uniref:5-formyltetrahydrofolate cyclo-ligase n=1 Tax=Saccharomonospora saliphila TaxID=369829 RepID=UPI00036E7BD2|nr:5-formyltetrahydrofolate cyclo-ligase [Saccharomonospora saliphila]
MTDTDNDSPSTDGKAQWRKRIMAERRALTPQQQVSEAERLTEAALALPANVVCCYVPYGSEPGSAALLDRLRERGSRVLLPVIPAERGPLDWAEYTGVSSLGSGEFPPVREPQGPRLGPEEIAEAAVVLVPALAVDRRGVRLGKGAGYYDRSLPLATPKASLIAVVRDSEFVDELPAEPHDVRVGAVLTPERGLRSLDRDTETDRTV